MAKQVYPLRVTVKNSRRILEQMQDAVGGRGDAGFGVGRWRSG